ncbi:MULTISPECIES: hypothetical protein [unclassified Streptomyces]|uniref:hypothetical protein n=1 Tax=unclassified Streptomyces TaxID=2593676 RepID=UPI000DC75A16|nr:MULTISPECIES: hypothetical protein [unclassified Streptomyces]AWZ09454.1 hypothetical protein DRB89_38995 [Streptomyces sp. ICC4]AWZ17204.1 hypothetical protein DRB96_39360 [Streptomyces sp. ICC1]
MRLRKALALSAVLVAVTAAAAPTAAADIGTGGGARPAPALPSRVEASCGDGKSTQFPIGARIRGGPAVYRTGGAPQTWYLDLTNTTASQCTAIHPVVVFTDKARTLRPAHFRMEFDAPGAPGGGFPVSLEHTDRDEIIAVFDGGDAFSGFTVGPGGSVTVTVRLAFAPGTPLGEAVADAALVQRKGDDGDWVGEAGGYRFDIEGPGAGETGEAGALAGTGGPGRPAWVYGAGAGAALVGGAGLLFGARRLRTSPL